MSSCEECTYYGPHLKGKSQDMPWPCISCACGEKFVEKGQRPPRKTLRERVVELEQQLSEAEAENNRLNRVGAFLVAQECDICSCLFIPGGKGAETTCGTCLKDRVKALEDALRLISSGRGLVEDKSTVYMNGSSPVAQKHFNTRDMIEIASKALEAECPK